MGHGPRQILLFALSGSVALAAVACPSRPESRIYGTWRADESAFRASLGSGDGMSDLTAALVGTMTLTFSDDGSLVVGVAGTSESGTWRLVEARGDQLVVETSGGDGAVQTRTLTLRSDASLVVREGDRDIPFRRAP